MTWLARVAVVAAFLVASFFAYRASRPDEFVRYEFEDVRCLARGDALSCDWGTP